MTVQHTKVGSNMTEFADIFHFYNSSTLFVFLKARRLASKQLENDLHVVGVLRVLITHRKTHFDWHSIP